MRCSTPDIRTVADIARFRFREIYTDRKRTQQHKQSFYAPAYNFVSQAFDNLWETAPTVEKRLLFGTHVRVGRVWPLATGRIIYPSSGEKKRKIRTIHRQRDALPPTLFSYTRSSRLRKTRGCRRPQHLCRKGWGEIGRWPKLLLQNTLHRHAHTHNNRNEPPFFFFYHPLPFPVESCKS